MHFKCLSCRPTKRGIGKSITAQRSHAFFMYVCDLLILSQISSLFKIFFFFSSDKTRIFIFEYWVPAGTYRPSCLMNDIKIGPWFIYLMQA